MLLRAQNLDFLHACDKPPQEDIIEKILGKKFVKEPYVDVPVIYTFLEDILNDTIVDTEDSSDEEPRENQDDVDSDINNDIDNTKMMLKMCRNNSW